MKTTLRRFEKEIGNVRLVILEKMDDGKISREITFTRCLFDGNDLPTFADEGDLAQLGMAVWRAQEWLKQQDEVSQAEA